MSWTQVFPVLTDDMIKDYKAGVTKEEKLQFEDWFGVAKILNPRKTKHTVCVSLFWKNVHLEDPELPVPTRKILKHAKELGLVKRTPPWEYVKPLLEGAKRVQSERPDANFRIYLAADMEFLAEDFTRLGCEVRVMKSSSIRHNPGAMWRFLALQEKDTLVTFSDSDRAHHILTDIERTDTMARAGLGMWRVPWLREKPILKNKDAVNANSYRPILGCQFGVSHALPSRRLMEALHWNTVKGRISPFVDRPGCLRQRIFGTIWPNYGFDEWFLLAAVYPRMAAKGVLSFIPADCASRILPLDIEYVTWANPRSEMFYFGGGGSDCCGPPAEAVESLKPPGSSRLYRRWVETLEHHPRLPAKEKTNARTEPLTMVVARYTEDLTWLTKVPSDIRVVVYNKGQKIKERAVLDRIDDLHVLRNRGREADTYLHHVMAAGGRSDKGWTVFTQADPFPHSPDFLNLLAPEIRRRWKGVQALSWGWEENSGVPPQSLMNDEQREWLNGLRVRTQRYSLWTMDMLDFEEGGSRTMMRHYLGHHKLRAGWSVIAHFLEQCGLEELALEAWGASLGRHAFGALFAVHNSRLSLLPESVLPKMKKLAADFYVHGYLYERLWLHFFGLPFEAAAGANPLEAKLKPALVV